MRDQLVDEEVHKAGELKQVNIIPKVLQVIYSVLPHLHKLEEDEEALSDEAEDVAKILQ